MVNRNPERPASGRYLRLSVATLALVAVTGCDALVQRQTTYTTVPNIPVARQYSAYHARHPAMVDDGWVASFRSETLSALVAEAIANNQDLRAAAARVAEARSIARQAGAPLYPTVDAGLQVNRSGNLDGDDVNETTFGPRVEVAWEADVWGRLSSARRAAALDASAQVALFEAVRQTLAADVALAWIRVAGDGYLLQLARDEVTTRTRVLRNVEERVGAQTLLAVDGNLARSNVAIARARVATAEGNLARSVRVLEVLLGRYPASTLRDLGGLPGMPGAVPVGLPSELLERRPDLVARERQVAAAFNRTQEARVARLPRLTLSGDLVGNGSKLGNSLDSANIVWTIAAGLIAPLIDGGDRAEEVRVRTARQETALAEFGAAALRAFQEVEDALSDEVVLAEREAQLGRAVNELQQAISLEQDRFDAGEIDLNRVDDARLQFYGAQQQLAEARIARLQNRVRLHLALGGSFEERPAVTPDQVAVSQ